MRNILYSAIFSFTFFLTGISPIIASGATNTSQTNPETPLLYAPSDPERFDKHNFAGTIYIKPVKIAEEQDSLKIELDIYISSEAMSKRQSWTVMPEIFNSQSGDVYIFPAVIINGKVKDQHYNRRSRFGDEEILRDIPYSRIRVREDRDTVIRYAMSVPYALWMDRSSLRLRQVLGSPAGKNQLLTTEDSGEVVLAEYEPYRVKPLVNYANTSGDEKKRMVQGRAYLDFETGKSVLLPAYKRNPEELSKIIEVVGRVKTDPDFEILGIYIDGYASPEGSYALNDRLSRERAYAVKDFLRIAFALEDRLFHVTSVAEDWSGVREMVVESNMPHKDAVMRIIDSYGDYDWKEQRLKFLGTPWQIMLSDIFPRLRRVEYRIDFMIKDNPHREVINLSERRPEFLSQRDALLIAASLTDEGEIFTLFNNLYQNEKTAALNTSAVLLDRRDHRTAKKYLDLLMNDPDVYNNLGVYHLLRGESDDAEQCFIRAAATGIREAYHNLEEVRRKRDDDKLMERYNR